MLELGLKFTFAYLLGSLLGSLVVGRLRGGVDIRKVGSGNPGGTNALRTQGKVFALWVMMIDVGKGALAVLWIPALAIPGVGFDAEVDRALLTYAVAYAAVLGHVFPLWYEFRGGKGGATAAGVLCVIEPVLVAPLVALWLAIIGLTGWVGLATMGAALAAAVYIGLMRLPEAHGLFVFTCLIAALILYTHRSNIRRMLEGNETRFGAFLRRR